MELILDGKILEVDRVNRYNVDNIAQNLEVVLPEDSEDCRAFIKKKYDVIQFGENTLENMWFYSYSLKDNTYPTLSFISSETIGNELTVEEIYKIHDDSKYLINLLKEKQIPEKNNDYLQKLTRKTYDSVEINKYGGYTMLSADWIDELALWLKDKKVLEVGAGIGALSAELQKRKIDIIPIDNRSWDRFNWGEQEEIFNWTEVLIEDYFANASKYTDREIIILSYPVQGEYSYNALKFIRMMNPNSKIIFIGPFKNDYVTDDFIKEAELVNDETFNKIAEKYKYWTGHTYMQSQLLLLK